MFRPFKIIRHLLTHRRIQRFWAGLASQAATTPVDALREQRHQARQLRRHLDRVIQIAEDRLALPAIGSNAVHRPLGADWVWRPDPWRFAVAVPGQSSVPGQTTIGPAVQLFHDCRQSELTLRQVRNSRQSDLAPFGLRFDVFQFDGTFLSLVIELPELVCADLKGRHVIRLDCTLDIEKPLEIYARLNLRQGPNVEQMVRSLPIPPQAAQSYDTSVEFDLTYAKLDGRRIDRVWLDLILEGPELNQIVLRDITLSRRLGADL